MAVVITLFEWAGKKGPFKIRTHCEECSLTKSMLKDMLKREFKGLDVRFEVKPWLDNFFYCLARRAWHPPIVMVDGRKFHQFSHKNPLFDRKKLESFVKERLRRSKPCCH
ncbi:hypothetical protein D6825_00995 [Candidatus Woesearchaeota archaeon]|nr:MAG: hypothetical protein D6825_00995 [Candidatus Woesearchaeota archaeon]